MATIKRAQFNPSTLKAAYDPVTGKAIMKDTGIYICPVCGSHTPKYLDITFSNLVKRQNECDTSGACEGSLSQRCTANVEPLGTTFRLTQGFSGMSDIPYGATSACSWTYLGSPAGSGGRLYCFGAQADCDGSYWYYDYAALYIWVIYSPIRIPAAPHLQIVAGIDYDCFDIDDLYYNQFGSRICNYFPTEEDMIKCLAVGEKSYSFTVFQSFCCKGGTVKLEMV